MQPYAARRRCAGLCKGPPEGRRASIRIRCPAQWTRNLLFCCGSSSRGAVPQFADAFHDYARKPADTRTVRLGMADTEARLATRTAPSRSQQEIGRAHV